MRTTKKKSPRWDVLEPRSIGVFFVIAAAWIVVASLPDWESLPWRAAARLAGYAGVIAMLVPYLHVARRCFRYRRAGAMTRWLRWHIAAAYLAFFLVLIHCRGRANSPLTLTLVWLTWIVTVSGVVGYYGQKLLYRILPRLVPQEFGLERLEPERAALTADAEKLAKALDLKACPEALRTFCDAVTDCVAKPLAFGPAAWLRRSAPGALSDNSYERTRALANATQQNTLDALWKIVHTRRAIDLEYRLHQLGRLWLLVHGPAAWALLILMIEHAALSMWYGGF